MLHKYPHVLLSKCHLVVAQSAQSTVQSNAKQLKHYKSKMHAHASSCLLWCCQPAVSLRCTGNSKICRKQIAASAADLHSSALILNPWHLPQPTNYEKQRYHHLSNVSRLQDTAAAKLASQLLALQARGVCKVRQPFEKKCSLSIYNASLPEHHCQITTSNAIQKAPTVCQHIMSNARLVHGTLSCSLHALNCASAFTKSTSKCKV